MMTGQPCQNPVKEAETVTPQYRLVFDYDYQGRRVRKQVWKYDTQTGAYPAQPTEDLLFVYDDWNLVAEIDNAVSPPRPIRTHLWGQDISGTLQGAGGVGGLIATTHHTYDPTPATSTYFVAYDGNGNVMALVDAADGSLDAEYDYDPWGSVEQADGIASEANTLGASSKYRDHELNAMYYGYRYLASKFRKWISRDPIYELGGSHLYAYVNNAPMQFVDDLGHKGTPIMPSPQPSPPTVKPDPCCPTPGVPPSAPGTVVGPGVAAGQTDRVTKAGLEALEDLIKEGKICETLRAVTESEIRNRSARGGASIIRAQLPQVDKILQNAIRKSEKGCSGNYYRYDRLSGLTSFSAGTDVTTRGGLSWSRAISITYFEGIKCLFVYYLHDRGGAVGPHPDGPLVMGIPQFQLTSVIAGEDVKFVKRLNKGDGD